MILELSLAFAAVVVSLALGYLVVTGARLHTRGVEALDALLTQERAHNDHLLTMLEAKTAPNEHYANVALDPYEGGTWLTDDTGLIAYRFNED